MAGAYITTLLLSQYDCQVNRKLADAQGNRILIPTSVFVLIRRSDLTRAEITKMPERRFQPREAGR